MAGAVQRDDTKVDIEPVGIVISRGKRDEPTPALWAYIWGPAPEADPPAAESKAA